MSGRHAGDRFVRVGTGQTNLRDCTHKVMYFTINRVMVVS
jgi:hypothetical protein